MGRSVRRKMATSIPSNSSRIGAVIHPTRPKKSRTMSSISTSRCARSCDTSTHNFAPAMSAGTLTPKISAPP